MLPTHQRRGGPGQDGLTGQTGTQTHQKKYVPEVSCEDKVFYQAHRLVLKMRRWFCGDTAALYELQTMNSKSNGSMSSKKLVLIFLTLLSLSIFGFFLFGTTESAPQSRFAPQQVTVLRDDSWEDPILSYKRAQQALLEQNSNARARPVPPVKPSPQTQPRPIVKFNNNNNNNSTLPNAALTTALPRPPPSQNNQRPINVIDNQGQVPTPSPRPEDLRNVRLNGPSPLSDRLAQPGKVVVAAGGGSGGGGPDPQQALNDLKDPKKPKEKEENEEDDDNDDDDEEEEDKQKEQKKDLKDKKQQQEQQKKQPSNQQQQSDNKYKDDLRNGRSGQQQQSRASPDQSSREADDDDGDNNNDDDDDQGFKDRVNAFFRSKKGKQNDPGKIDNNDDDGDSEQVKAVFAFLIKRVKESPNADWNMIESQTKMLLTPKQFTRFAPLLEQEKQRRQKDQKNRVETEPQQKTVQPQINQETSNTERSFWDEKRFQDKQWQAADPLSWERRTKVKEAAEFWLKSYNGQWGHDEVRPCTNRSNDSWGGFGISIVDSLDTMIMLGLEEWVDKSIKHVHTINWNKHYDASLFETTIRYIGGLLGAYQLYPVPIFLQKATELADRLLAGFFIDISAEKLTEFNLSSMRLLPNSIINLKEGTSRNPSWTSGNSILSEVGSIQMEFKFLSLVSGDPRYWAAAEKAQRTIEESLTVNTQVPPYLWPVYLSPDGSSSFSSVVSVGTFSDSYYEYMLKQAIMLGILSDDLKSFDINVDLDLVDSSSSTSQRNGETTIRQKSLKASSVTDRINPSGKLAISRESLIAAIPPNALDAQHFLDLYEKTLPSLLDNLYFSDPTSDFHFMGELHYGKFQPNLSHLSCFFGGTMALGLISKIKESPVSTNPEYLSIADNLVSSCVKLYQATRTGLAADTIHVNLDRSNPPRVTSFYYPEPKFILRPETIESLFYMWRLTHDQKYRDWGWDIFQAIEKHCKTTYGYTGLHNVDHLSEDGTAIQNDSTPSFFMAETIKYLWLLFSPDSEIDLTKVVFNTEAHAFGMLPAKLILKNQQS